ncbi:XRE family transcriptional regulator [Hydrogenobacter thermophilus]|uniref:XRE family transcriptional regulator n=1 Tax=Hydrogenobacter thermophilus TaxID=940 RepID=UPI0030F87A57
MTLGQEMGRSIGERIRRVREEKGLSQKEFGEAIGKSWRTILRYESGQSVPDEATLIAISRTFGVSLEWLKYGTGDMWLKSEEVIQAELIAVPVITSVGAGGFVYTPDHVLVERSKIKAKSLVAFKVEGDSMEPTIMRGEFVFIEEATEAEDNKVYLIACEEDNGLKVRRLRKIEGKWWLFCDNPAYPPEALKEECKIVGRVVGIYKPAEVKYL